jgi:alpha-tubulin suppressor-like RCC1 family protein
VLCWGTSQVGEIGTLPGGEGDPFPNPTPMGANSDFDDLSAFGRHACARRATGEIVCFGSDNYGQLGDGGMCANGAAEARPPFAGIDDIEVGYWHTFALAGGTLFAAGNSANGRLAVPSAPQCMYPSPFEIAPAGSWVAVAGGDTHSCAIRSDGGANRLYCAGQAEHRALGVAGGDSDAWVEPVPSITDFEKVFAGNSNGCAIRAGGGGMCWGCTTDECAGALGLGPAGDALPTDVGTDVAEFALWNHGCMRTNDGALACSGPNADGRLGVGDLESRNTFTPVEPGSRWLDVDAGPTNTCGVREGGAIYCWGANTFRVLGETDTMLVEARPFRVCVDP